MLDCFVLLEQPRRPWLDSDVLKQKFLAASAANHPDRFHQAAEPEKRAAQARFTELNTAYQRLSDPRERIRHLLELELGARPPDVQQIPQQLVDLFMEIGQVTRTADAMLREQQDNSSPLLKLQWFERAQNQIAGLNELQQKLKTRIDGLLIELKAIDEQWSLTPTLSRENREEARRLLLRRLELLHPLFGYFNRWSTQIQDRIMRLSL